MRGVMRGMGAVLFAVAIPIANAELRVDGIDSDPHGQHPMPRLSQFRHRSINDDPIESSWPTAPFRVRCANPRCEKPASLESSGRPSLRS